MSQGLNEFQIAGLVTAIASNLHRYIKLPRMIRSLISEAARDHLKANGLFLDDAKLVDKMSDQEIREIFETMHKNRNLKKHLLRGTYVSAPIAALWNQHVKTIRYMSNRNTN